MRLAKKILKSDLVRRILCWVISIYLRIVYNTSKWQYEESEFLQPLYESGKPFIIALWHNRVVMMPYAWRYPTAISIFTSDHRDGKLVAYTMGWFGFSTIFGSTRRTDLKTMRTIVKSLKAGELLGMTPDGPRGPRMRLKPGVISIAKLAGVPIIPVAYSCSRCKVLDTWDNLIVPLPFSRGVFLWGDPLSLFLFSPSPLPLSSPLSLIPFSSLKKKDYAGLTFHTASSNLSKLYPCGLLCIRI